MLKIYYVIILHSLYSYIMPTMLLLIPVIINRNKHVWNNNAFVLGIYI